MADNDNGEGNPEGTPDNGANDGSDNDNGGDPTEVINQRLNTLEKTLGTTSKMLETIANKFKEEDEEQKRKLEEAKTEAERLKELQENYGELEKKYKTLENHVTKEAEAKRQQLLEQKTELANSIVSKNPTFTVDELVSLDMSVLEKLDVNTKAPERQSRFDGREKNTETPEERYQRLMKERQKNIDRRFNRNSR